MLIACRKILQDLTTMADSVSERVYSKKIDQIDQNIKFCNFKLSKGK